jgi:hypothetical protein
VYSFYLKTTKKNYIHSSIEDSEVVLVLGCNKAGLKKLFRVLSERGSDLSAFLIAMCLKHVLNCEQHFSVFIFQSKLTVTGLARVCNMAANRRKKNNPETHVAGVLFYDTVSS